MKETRKYLLGVAFGFAGMILYTFSLRGYESISYMDVLNALKAIAMPFMFTELFVILGVEGFGNLKQEFINLKKKLNKKVTKKEVEA